MVNELDFEEIDQALDDMNSLDGITDAIAEDVAKIDKVAKNTTPKKPKSAKKTVVKKTTNNSKPKLPASKKASVEPKTDHAKAEVKKPEPVVKQETKTEPESEPEKSDDGEIVMVKVKKKPAPEPVPVVYQPNPKTGKFMDIVSPLSDMSIKGARPLKNELNNAEIEEVVPVIEAETSVIEVAPIEMDSIISDRERIENSGLDPDEPVGNLADQLDEAEGEVNDSFSDILQNFDNEPEKEIAEEVMNDVEDDLEKLADILDIPDHSDAFLENVEIAKRPLGRNEEVMGAMAVTETKSSAPIPDMAEMKASKEFVEDTKGLDDWFDDKKEKKPKAEKKAKKKKADKPAKKSGNVVLYVLLIVLFVILGASLGILAYFSGLF